MLGSYLAPTGLGSVPSTHYIMALLVRDLYLFHFYFFSPSFRLI